MSVGKRGENRADSDQQIPALTRDADRRYVQQVRFLPIGADGQRKLESKTVLLVGCGALGSALAETLVRAGVGRMRIVDRDFVDLSNLQRQSLFTEQHVRKDLPKAVAAAKVLNEINSMVSIEPVVEDVNSSTIGKLCRDVDLILDGTDNFETRFLINDVSCELKIPWVYGGCLGSNGQTMSILPGTTICLHCLMPDGPPAAGAQGTCDSNGIIGPAVNAIAAFQSAEALKILVDDLSAVSRKLTVVDLWTNQLRALSMTNLLERGGCQTCRGERRLWLQAERELRPDVLCGRNSVQLRATSRSCVDLPRLANRLADAGCGVRCNEFLLKLAIDDSRGQFELTLFQDGRAIVSGTADPMLARSLYTRYVGN